MTICIETKLLESSYSPPLAKSPKLKSVLTRTSLRFALLPFALLLCGNSFGNAGESVIPLLSGFDQERVAATYPPTDGKTLGELAKLLYRLRSVDPVKLQVMATRNANVSDSGASQSISIGDAVPLAGTIKSMQLVPIPKKLIEFLE